MKPILSEKWIKVPVFLLCLAPLARLLWRGLQDKLGANPIEFITHETGDWTLIFLVLTLCVSPARKLFRQPQLIRFRRMFGLFAFFYGCLHFMTYIWLDKFFDLSEMLADVTKRRFITLGLTGFVLMIPLAATSTAAWIRRLGGRRWQALHRLIYVSAVAGVAHYYWLVKSDVRKPVGYGTIVALLLAWRLWFWLRAKNSRTPASSASRKELTTAGQA
jgi:methionine sulfoxide reductase heme-binding subunit